VILLLFGIAGLALGFLPPNILLPSPPNHIPTFGSSFVLCHAKKGTRKKMANAGGKKKKNKQSNKSLYEKEVARASQKASVVLPGVKTRAPPWQVLSSEDAKQNVKQEKIRRKRAREEGIHQVPETTNEQLKSKALMSDANRMLLKWKRFNPTTEPCGISFIGSYLEKRLPPKLGVPEVAFLGRSNVGKSSLLNRLSSSAKSNKFAKDEARVGKTPGATASVNLYAMLGKAKQNTEMSKPILGLADLPGFGYAKLSKDVKEAVQLAAERYLGKREELALGILLVDARRDPSEDDRAVLAALYDMGVPLVVVATKVDKLTKSEVEPSLEIIRRGLGLPHGQPLCVSSVTGEGTKELWKIVLEACEVHVEELRDKLERANAEKNDAEDGSYETLTLGDKGNPLLFEDDEDVVYDQGFDWVHDSAVMYDGGDSEGFIDGDDEVEVGDQWEDDEGDGFDDMEYDNKEAFRLKNLKKRVRGMERRGEI
jgi:GTP-binding protein